MKKARLAGVFAVLAIAVSMAAVGSGKTPTSSTATVCIRDDSASRFVTVDTNSGAFRFTNCETGVTLIGSGTVTKGGAVVSILARGASILFDSADQIGIAIVDEGNGLPTTITDRNTADSVCGCF